MVETDRLKRFIKPIAVETMTVGNILTGTRNVNTKTNSMKILLTKIIEMLIILSLEVAACNELLLLPLITNAIMQNHTPRNN